jgi:glycosyltransferase involved in cell wall biosynthesis
MKILHIALLFHGGVGAVVSNLTRELAKMRHEIVLATPSQIPNKLKDSLMYNYFLRIPFLKEPFYVIQFYGFNKKKLEEIIKLERPEIVVTHGPLVAIAKVICNIPVISIVHGTYANEVRWMWYHPIFGLDRVRYLTGIYTSYHLDMTLYKYIAKLNNVYLVAVSRNTKKELIKAGAMPGKVFSILNGVNKELFKPMDKERARALVKEWFGVELKDKVLLHVNPGPMKGTHMLIKAIAQLEKIYGRDFILLIVGRLEPKTYRKHIEEMIRGLGLEKNVKMLGYVENERLSIIYNSADLTVVPSYSEGGPLITPESLACGTPVIATNVGGNFEYLKLVRSENFVIEIKQYDFSKGLALKIFEALMTSRKELNCDAIRGWDDIAKAYLSIFESLLQ